jgi:hypothetical protein
MSEETILETDKPLSKSLLWELQNRAYTQFGIDAWSREGVPFYLTSNPFIAKQYAHIVLGYLRDNLETLDQSLPLYILDLGAGTGRFAYLFLKKLTLYLQQLSLEKIPIRYVMTDISPANLEFWQHHPKLQPFFEKKILDCAYYDYAQETPIQLMRSCEVLTSENPIILIANYFFDTIPQDLFRIKEGRLEEGRVTLSVEGKVDPHSLDPSWINRLKASYSYVPLNDSSKSDPLLQEYRDLDGSFLFPVGALQSIRYFEKLSLNRLLLIAGDQGVCTPQQIRRWGEPKIALHGTFSISVNYHAIGLYFRSRGGVGLLTSLPDPAFVVMAGIFGKGHFAETRGAFCNHLDAFEPSDYWKLSTYFEENASLEDLLLL